MPGLPAVFDDALRSCAAEPRGGPEACVVQLQGPHRRGRRADARRGGDGDLHQLGQHQHH